MTLRYATMPLLAGLLLALPGPAAEAAKHRKPIKGCTHKSRAARCKHVRHPVTTVAPAAATACADGDLRPTDANIAQVTTATLCLVNAERTKRGLTALRDNSRLDAAALLHSTDMVLADYFDHVSPTGSGPLGRIVASGYLPRGAGYSVGENIGLGTLDRATPAAVVAAWMDSPPHRANILNSAYRDSGLGILADVPASDAHGQAGAIYTQEFGVVN